MRIASSKLPSLHRRLAVAAGVAIIVLLIAGVAVTPARATSPAPTWKMLDSNIFDGYPAGYNAGVLVAYAPGCNGSNTGYYPPSVESQAENWINDKLQTVIMMTLYSSCDGTLADYENLANSLVRVISAHVSTAAFDRYFYGFMVDEEPLYWSSASTAASFNEWLLDNEPGVPLAEIGVYPGYWTQQSEYNEVAWEYSWPAPQVYNADTESDQNTLVKDYGGSNTLVTCYPGKYAYPYNTCANAASVIDGSSWSYSTWGSGHWYNQFRPA